MKAFICLCGIFAASSVVAAPYNTSVSNNGGMTSGNNSGSMTTPQNPDSRVFRNNDSWNPTYESASATKASDRFTTGDDQKLGSQIRQQIVELIGLPRSGDVILYVDYGDVKLIGKVPSDEIKGRISQVIREIKGVKSLNNRLESANATTNGTSTTGFRPSSQAPLSANTNPSGNPYYNSPQSNANPSTNPYSTSTSNINQPGSYYNRSPSTQTNYDQSNQNQPSTTYYRTSSPTNMNQPSSSMNSSNQPSTTYYRSPTQTNPNPSDQSVNSYYNRSPSSTSQSYTTPSNEPSSNIYNNPSYTGATPSHTTPKQSYTGSSSTSTYNRY